MMINDSTDFDIENEEGTNSVDNPSFGRGGLVGIIVKETLKEGTREVSKSFFSWLGDSINELISDD